MNGWFLSVGCACDAGSVALLLFSSSPVVAGTTIADSPSFFAVNKFGLQIDKFESKKIFINHENFLNVGRPANNNFSNPHYELIYLNEYFKEFLDPTKSEKTQFIDFNKISYFTGVQKFHLEWSMMDIVKP